MSNMKWRKKPVVIEAIKWDGKAETLAQIVSFVLPRKAFMPLKDESELKGAKLYIETLEGNMMADVGDQIIKGVNGECYPCKPDIFAKTYEPATEYWKHEKEFAKVITQLTQTIQEHKDVIEKLKRVLGSLVYLKNEKDINGKTPIYLENKEKAWNDAKELIFELNIDTLNHQLKSTNQK